MLLAVIPERAGFCQASSCRCFRLLGLLCSQRWVRARSRRSARSVARTNGLDRGPARRRLVVAEERSVNSVVGKGCPV